MHQASAESRTLSVTLAGGRVVQVTVDVPPGTPIDQIPLPDLGAPVIRVSDASPQLQSAPPTPTAGTTTSTPQTTPTVPQGESAARRDGGGDDSGGDGREAARRANDADQRRQKAAEQAAKDKTDGKKVTRSSGDDSGDGADGATRDEGGAPTPADPTFSEAIPGAAPIGVPNFFIDKFRIPPFLLPIYQAAGTQYGVRWEILAAINEIETDFGRNLSVSSAGALGWMQFMPATWKMYGVDANGDGKQDPYNPVDAIFAAARYLRAAGAEKDIKKAIFAYNHADWYVDSVLMRARLFGGLPPDLVGSLTGLTQGVFPVAAKARYAGGRERRPASDLYARAGAAAIAVQDGEIVKVGSNPRLGRFVQLRDVYGNTYTYGNLKSVSAFYPVAKTGAARGGTATRLDPGHDPKPTVAATAGRQRAGRATAIDAEATDTKERVFANPARPVAKALGGAEQLANAELENGSYSSYLSSLHGLSKDDIRLKRLKKGARVMAGTVLGRIGKTDAGRTPHLQFEIRPAGKGAPRVDPKPILDGWKLLESTAVYRAKGQNPLFGNDGNATAGQVLLMSKAQLQDRVLADRHIDIYPQGRTDIAAGAIDRRVLATLEYLTANGLRLTITSLRSGHGYLTASGNVSEHSSGNAVDIAAVNGITIAPKTQGPGTITDSTIRLLLQLQGAMKPHQIISLMTFPGTDNTMSLPDHDDHIHVGFRPTVENDPKLGKQIAQILKPNQWIKLIDRISEIDNPTVLTKPSKYALRTPRKDD
ncbi:lytic murein transglycosylase [Patulibacter defluvii]|uniref:lytic murein transglycosylase n=1 Tax=Patulibacter defluvii TaxID=3095358 RepID=UPI002A74E308|nr:lytic murein transglycosylase [Patulibacter sp. DM4]